jgi:hypothetical protein
MSVFRQKKTLQCNERRVGPPAMVNFVRGGVNYTVESYREGVGFGPQFLANRKCVPILCGRLRYGSTPYQSPTVEDEVASR